MMNKKDQNWYGYYQQEKGKNKHLQAELQQAKEENEKLKTEMDKWNLSTKDIERDLTFEEENGRLKAEITAAIELLEIGVKNAETGIPLWESVGNVQEILAQALKGEKGE